MSSNHGDRMPQTVINQHISGMMIYRDAGIVAQCAQAAKVGTVAKEV